jgi:hypothetical protein
VRIIVDPPKWPDDPLLENAVRRGLHTSGLAAIPLIVGMIFRAYL